MKAGRVAEIMVDACGLLGLGMLAAGMWMIYPPVCLIVLGLMLAAFAYLADRVRPGARAWRARGRNE